MQSRRVSPTSSIKATQLAATSFCLSSPIASSSSIKGIGMCCMDLTAGPSPRFAAINVHSTLPHDVAPQASGRGIDLPHQLQLITSISSFTTLSHQVHLTEDPQAEWRCGPASGLNQHSNEAGPSGRPGETSPQQEASLTSSKANASRLREWTPGGAWRLARVGSWQTDAHDRAGVASAAGFVDKVR